MEYVHSLIIDIQGVEPSIRPTVWKYLLHYYDFDTTLEERLHQKIEAEYKYKILVNNSKQYETIKNQWLTITGEQLENHSVFRQRSLQIEKDITRTDRTLELFEDENGPGIEKLRNILTTYSFFNWDIGYCQGMNDILVPIMLNIEEEGIAFTCFKSIYKASNINNRLYEEDWWKLS